jgi:hypothetical protein
MGETPPENHGLGALLCPSGTRVAANAAPFAPVRKRIKIKFPHLPSVPQTQKSGLHYAKTGGSGGFPYESMCDKKLWGHLREIEQPAKGKFAGARWTVQKVTGIK